MKNQELLSNGCYVNDLGEGKDTPFPSYWCPTDEAPTISSCPTIRPADEGEDISQRPPAPPTGRDPSPSTAEPSTSSDTTDEEDSSLSTGAIVGIVVACIVVTAAIGYGVYHQSNKSSFNDTDA